jgi:hypothetical protein
MVAPKDQNAECNCPSSTSGRRLGGLPERNIWWVVMAVVGHSRPSNHVPKFTDVRYSPASRHQRASNRILEPVSAIQRFIFFGISLPALPQKQSLSPGGCIGDRGASGASVCSRGYKSEIQRCRARCRICRPLCRPYGTRDPERRKTSNSLISPWRTALRN